MTNTLKLLFLSFSMILLPGCRIFSTSKSLKKGNLSKESVSGQQMPSNNYGAIVKSEPFSINSIKCYWEQTDTLADGTLLTAIKLKEFKTNRILIDHADCCLKYGFDFQSSDNFLDVNFDGFKDFLIRSYGSMAMFELTNIYLFDNHTKEFAISDLSDNGIETDSVNRRLITTSFDHGPSGGYDKTKIHYFDTFGKVKYTEVITTLNPDTIPAYTTYQKIVDGEVIETKTDSVINIER